MNRRPQPIVTLCAIRPEVEPGRLVYEAVQCDGVRDVGVVFADVLDPSV